MKLTVLFLLGVLWCPVMVNASMAATPQEQSDTTGYGIYKGVVADWHTGSPLAFVSLVVEGSNISTVTNREGAFSLKIPDSLYESNISISFLGYRNKTVPVSSLKGDKDRILLEAVSVMLPEVRVHDAASLVNIMLGKRKENYLDNRTLMTAFYRETVRKRGGYVSLLEAVADIQRFSYSSERNDLVSLYKVRKKADYKKLDTLILKLMGGPYNTLYVDIMKYTDLVFPVDMMHNYEFKFDPSTRIDDRLIYVVDFKQVSSFNKPLFYGKLYIDANSYALVSAVYSLNLENREEATRYFIVNKPANANVYPKRVKFIANYLQKDGKWYLGYGRTEIDVLVDWKKKFFNTVYESVMEMAVTDWVTDEEGNRFDVKERLKPSAVVADQTSGFMDPLFWGEFNVIEPEKPINAAIKKIQKQLEKR